MGSAIGDNIVPVATVLYVTDLTGSPTDLGLVLGAQMLPFILLLLVGGVWADRLPRARLMAATDVIRCARDHHHRSCKMSVEMTPAGTRGKKPPPSGTAGRAMMRVLRTVHKLTGNKMGGMPLLHLTTIGARSGQSRTVVVMAFAEAGDSWLIVASRAGSTDHPAWFYNLAGHPDQVEIEIDGRSMAATAETLSGTERDAAWARIMSEQSRFAGYAETTDREIPVVRLTAKG